MKATSFPLTQITDREIDLNDVAGADGFLFVREGVGFAALGISARTNAANARNLLSGRWQVRHAFWQVVVGGSI